MDTQEPTDIHIDQETEIERSPERRSTSLWVFVALGVLAVVFAIGGIAALMLSSSSNPKTSRSSAPDPNGFGSLVGIAPTVKPVGDSWKTHRNATAGVTVGYPPGWSTREQASPAGVMLYPPESDPELPSPLIALTFFSDHPYEKSAANKYTTTPTPITVAGLVGRQFADGAFAVPVQSSYIELPYRGGTLLITATMGPNVDLVPQLSEILKSLRVDQ